MSSTTMQIQEIYVGLLGRAADAEGLAYWKAEIDGGVLSIEELRANIVNEQPEYAANLGTLSRTDLVTELYDNLFNREPDDAGLAYWVTGGGSTVNADQLVLALVNGAAVADEAVLANRTEVANYYTDSGVAYNASSAASVIADVDGADASVQSAKSDISLLASATASTLTEGGTYDYSGSGPVSITIAGDDDATDGDDFTVTGSRFNDTFALQKDDFRELTISGGDGVDTLDMSDNQATVNALTGRANFEGNTTNIAEFTGIERFVFDDDADTFTGGGASETIVGGGGNDNLNGGAGDDTFVFADTEELSEVARAITGGIGTDTLQIGVVDSSGIKVDLTGTNHSTSLTVAGSIEKLVVTGLEKDGSQVLASTITIDEDTTAFTQIVGATSKDKLVIESSSDAAVDLSSWKFSNIAEVKTESANDQAVTVKQAQLDMVERWVSDNDTDTLVLKAETGAASQTWDLTENYFNGWLSVEDDGAHKATLIVDQATIAGFTTSVAGTAAKIDIDDGDTLQIKGDADITGTNFVNTDASLVIDGTVVIDNDDVASAGTFDDITATSDSASLVFSGSAVVLDGVKLTGLSSIVGSSSNNTFSLDADTTGIDGLTITSSGKVIFKETGKGVTEDYADYSGLTLAGSNVAADINGQVSLDQDTVSGLRTLVGVGTDNDIWATGDLDLSTITTLTSIEIKDTSADNAITAASAAGTYNFTKGGADTFTGGSKADTLVVNNNGSLTADLGAGANVLTVGSSTSGAADKSMAVTASFGVPNGATNTVDVHANSTGAVNLTFATFTKAADKADIDLKGDGVATVTFGDAIVDGDIQAVHVKHNDGAKGDLVLTGGQGFFDIDLQGASGDATIVLGDGGHSIVASNAPTGNISVTVGENLDNDGGSDPIGIVDLATSTATNSITTGAGGWTIKAGKGLDTIVAGSGSDTITAGRGGDSIDISAGGSDAITFDTVATLGANDTEISHVDTFVGYATVDGFVASSDNNLGDKILLTNIDDDTGTGSSADNEFDNFTLTFSTFGTNDINTGDNDDLYIYTGEVSDLTDVSAVVDAIGTVQNDAAADDFYVVINSGSDTFGVYEIDLSSTFGSGNDIDHVTGSSIKLLGIVDGDVTGANAANYFDGIPA